MTLGIGSAAAAIQSAIAPVAGGSAFALLQSAGAGGYGVPIVHGVVQAGSALAMSVAAAASRKKKQSPANTALTDPKDDDLDEESEQGNEEDDDAKDTDLSRDP